MRLSSHGQGPKNQRAYKRLQDHQSPEPLFRQCNQAKRPLKNDEQGYTDEVSQSVKKLMGFQNRRECLLRLRKTLIKYIKNIYVYIYITKATGVIHHATHTTVYEKKKKPNRHLRQLSAKII